MAEAKQEAIERTFTAHVFYVIADLMRDVANGTIPADRVPTLRKALQDSLERMPVWVHVCMNKDGNLHIGLFQKCPDDSPAFLSAMEEIRTEDSTEFDLVSIYAETKPWGHEAMARLMQSPLMKYQYPTKRLRDTNGRLGVVSGRWREVGRYDD